MDDKWQPCVLCWYWNWHKLHQFLACLYRVGTGVGHTSLTLLHSERPKLHTILAFLSAIGLKFYLKFFFFLMGKALSDKLSCMWTGLV